MLVFGGHDGAKHLNDFYEFNFDTLVQLLYVYKLNSLQFTIAIWTSICLRSRISANLQFTIAINIYDYDVRNQFQ